MIRHALVPHSVPALLLTLLCTGAAESAAAQIREPTLFARVSTATEPDLFEKGRPSAGRAGVAAAEQNGRPVEERTGFAAFSIEALGGAAGSAAGFGIGVLLADPDECNNEDLHCIFQDFAVALGASAAGAALGTWGAGSLADTRPSLPGAALGGLAGAVAGLGTVHLLTEEMDLNIGDGVQFVSYVVTHGVVAALGSRLIAAIRD